MAPPDETNPDIDFTKIEDVIIHLRYTAKSDSGQFKESVKGLIQAMQKLGGTHFCH